MTVGEEILETYSHEETAYHLQNSENERTVPNLFETVREQSNICNYILNIMQYILILTFFCCYYYRHY